MRPDAHAPTDRPVDWYTTAEAGALCRRSQKTIENLISLHELPRKLGWLIKNRKRRRSILLSPSVVAELQGLTILKRPRRRRPMPTA